MKHVELINEYRNLLDHVYNIWSIKVENPAREREGYKKEINNPYGNR